MTNAENRLLVAFMQYAFVRCLPQSVHLFFPGNLSYETAPFL